MKSLSVEKYNHAVLALILLADNAEGVVKEFEKGATCGPDLADEIRIFLKPAILNAKSALKIIRRRKLVGKSPA